MNISLKKKKLKNLNNNASINQAQTPYVGGGSSYVSANGYGCSGTDRPPYRPLPPH
ncbi:hypothetical protein L1077_20395 [Pseudoalteromonas luteoviolacea]|uniref:hypothetical protein n=1 Tax=Pseudoalteromonas luteoviolacea TaxID=43657 RepID=UPI001F3EFAB3|nr:hypothetical protein [Pseudoalteromonas luteoviolacea]MCF6441800.1 hypothetical protein [Pseudoalteromonas luteoviolacea]